MAHEITCERNILVDHPDNKIIWCVAGVRFDRGCHTAQVNGHGQRFKLERLIWDRMNHSLGQTQTQIHDVQVRLGPLTVRIIPGFLDLLFEWSKDP